MTHGHTNIQEQGVYDKRTAIPLQAWTVPEGSRRLRLPKFLEKRHLKVATLPILCTGHLYSPGDIPGNHFCQRPSRHQDHSAAERMKSIKNQNNAIGNRTRGLPAFSALSEPPAPPRAPVLGQWIMCEQKWRQRYVQNAIAPEHWLIRMLINPLKTDIHLRYSTDSAGTSQRTDSVFIINSDL